MTMKELLDRVQGKSRMLSRRELVERDFADFLAWLKTKGVAGEPYYFFEKETWDFIIWQRYWTMFEQERQAKQQTEERAAVVINALKDAQSALRGAVISGLLAWPKEEREKLAVLLQPPVPLPDADGSPADVGNATAAAADS